MIKDVWVPKHVEKGIRPLTCSYEPAEIWGCDFETVNGEPYTMQIKFPDDDHFEYLNDPGAGFTRLLDMIHHRNEQHVRVYFWGLHYDLPCLLYDQIKMFRYRDFTKSFRWLNRNGKITVSCDKSWFARVRWGRFRVQLIDAFQYFRTGLDKAAKNLLGVAKLMTPKRIGTYRYKSKAFEEYAKRDARLTYDIAQIIEKKHLEADLSPTVSASHFAAKTYRKHYLKEIIPYLPKPVEIAAILSYHGGLNWVTPEAPAFFERIKEYDITSAYPDGFLHLPNFEGGRWVQSRDERPSGHAGFLRVQFSSQCPFYGVRGHDFAQIESGSVWVTSWEYHSCKSCLRDLRIKDGWYWEGGGDSPFKEYMEHFYNAKSTASNPTDKEFSKICLNGISGKLVQNRLNEKDVWEAGGLWNPALASLVTGYTRALMHRYLHLYKGIHCATDSFFTPEDGVECSPGMGGLQRKACGDLLLLRNKLYVFFDVGTERIIKWGAHGFWGDAEKLIELWKERKTKYTIDHIYKVRESFAQKKTPLKMETVERELGICWDAYKRSYRYA